MFETMLRSGVPPHIGQSPVPGSDIDPRLLFAAPDLRLLLAAQARLPAAARVTVRMVFFSMM
jgi:hypothetical protein